jgi:hypothetical protein
MNVLKMLAANAPATGNQTLYQIIDGLGLTTNLKVCLDAGDIASYNPSVDPQKWLDTSGNGFDWFVGNDGSVDATDPTFNGTAGSLTSSEYFNVGNNGTTRRFLYDIATPETWMQRLSEDNAIYTLMAVWKPQLSTVFQPVFNFGYGTVAGTRGMVVIQTSSETLELRIYNSAGSSTELTISAANQTINGWNVLLISWDEAGNYAWRNNANTGSGNAAYTRFGAFTGVAHLFSSLPANTLAACAAIWEGTALTSTNLTDLYNGIKGRFGL